MKICLNLIATGRYVDFLGTIIESAEKNFFPENDVHYIIHTDCTDRDFPQNSIINKIEFEPWPNPTLKRFHYFLMKEKEILESDFSFYVDVDSLFVNQVTIQLSEISGMLPTLHPGFYNRVGTPERNPVSKAYIPRGANNLYFCGGFFGGDSVSFVEMSKIIRSNIDEDLNRGIIAIWHDESHLNHYLFHNPPKNTLGNNFAIAEKDRKEFPNSPLIFLDKNHSEMRGTEENPW
jgi:histo-blood group ABO system transferase